MGVCASINDQYMYSTCIAIVIQLCFVSGLNIIYLLCTCVRSYCYCCVCCLS